MSSHTNQLLSDYSKIDKIQMLKNVKESDIHVLPSPRRTDGDGMENAVDAKLEHLKHPRSSLGNKLIYRPENFKNLASPPPPIITGKIVNLVPKHAITHKKSKSFSNMKPREPKFVPYEPYKAAVKPIIPYEKSKRERKDKNPNYNINEMIRKMSIVQIEEQLGVGGGLQNNIKDSIGGLPQVSISSEQEMANNCMRKEVTLLKEEKTQLEAQLKFQAQVNCDLKTLLVAAVGEDLETRVQHLTEDKLQLARALLSSAQVCTSHQERTEFLAGQCEVWRSKFLASSLMLEELASRKASLSLHVAALENVLRKLLDENSIIKEHTYNTFKCLSALRDSLAPSEVQEMPASASTLDLAFVGERLSLALKLQLIGRQERREVTRQPVDTTTEAEAKELLNNGVALGQQDAASNAVMGAAIAVATRQTACCSHCSGEIHQV